MGHADVVVGVRSELSAMLVRTASQSMQAWATTIVQLLCSQQPPTATRKNQPQWAICLPACLLAGPVTHPQSPPRAWPVPLLLPLPPPHPPPSAQLWLLGSLSSQYMQDLSCVVSIFLRPPPNLGTSENGRCSQGHCGLLVLALKHIRTMRPFLDQHQEWAPLRT